MIFCSYIFTEHLQWPKLISIRLQSDRNCLQMFWVMYLLCSINIVSKSSPLAYVINTLFVFSDSKIGIPGTGLSEDRVRRRLTPSSEHIVNPNTLVTLIVTTCVKQIHRCILFHSNFELL